MRRLSCHRAKLPALFAVLMLAAALPACKRTVGLVENRPPARRGNLPDMTDAKRLSDGASKLIDAINKPAQPFHFSFKGQENLASNRDDSPRPGPVSLQAEVSPEQTVMTETLGSVTKTAKTKSGDETTRALSNLMTLGVLTGPDMVIAIGSTVASPPTTDLVAGVLADKFTFDTTAPTPTQRVGLDAARAVLPAIKDCKGTAWIALDSGLLIKFNIDAQYRDMNDHDWQEHYEGVLTPR